MSSYAVLLSAVVIDDENGDLVIEHGGTEDVVSIAPGTYYPRGDGSADDLCKAVKDALDSGPSSANQYGVAFTTNGTTPSWNRGAANASAIARVARTSGAHSFRVMWNHDDATFDPAILGFAVEKGAADANPETSTLSPLAAWVGNNFHEDIVPGARWNVRSRDLDSGDTAVVRLGAKMKTQTLLLQYIDGRRMWEDVNTSDPAATLESFIDFSNDGRALEIHVTTLQAGSSSLLAALSSSTRQGTVWRLAEGGGDDLTPTRVRRGLDLWNHELVVVRGS